MRFPTLLRFLHPRQLWGLLLDSAQQWSRHRASSKGAALALYMVFSLAPMLILVIAVAGAFFGEEAVRSELFGQVRDLTGERGAEVIQTVLASAHESGKGWVAALISIFVLIFSATTAFAELKASLDELWEVDPDKSSGIQGMVRSRMLSFGLVLVLGLFLLLSLAVNAAMGVARGYYGELWNNSYVAVIGEWVSSLFSFAVVTALFAVVFKLLPSANVIWRHVIPGAVVTAALFLIGKWGIGLYLGGGGVTSAYGAAGSLIALLLWIYYSAQIFFFGAVFTRQYSLRAERLERGESADGTPAPDAPADAVPAQATAPSATPAATAPSAAPAQAPDITLDANGVPAPARHPPG
ncbi:hypothetical protein CAL27_24130 [Bordetella genomosp. 1]|uniref:Uncharacterized protein n=1 Tax=Bordetella genomosp. 1 TaxID=1395607 RepID=A0ABX4ET12_9BORD|nr:YihY/virulence factor BrkB family protein [Bordetella genomosp. 1]OZI55738.1 hypothetical protein CAL27_24130 [Bordetella genomosp. 1]